MISESELIYYQSQDQLIIIEKHVVMAIECSKEQVLDPVMGLQLIFQVDHSFVNPSDA